jgi:hypothetical protein
VPIWRPSADAQDNLEATDIAFNAEELAAIEELSSSCGVSGLNDDDVERRSR